MYLFCQGQSGNVNQRGWVDSLQTEAVVFCEGARASEQLPNRRWSGLLKSREQQKGPKPSKGQAPPTWCNLPFLSPASQLWHVCCCQTKSWDVTGGQPACWCVLFQLLCVGKDGSFKCCTSACMLTTWE